MTVQRYLHSLKGSANIYRNQSNEAKDKYRTLYNHLLKNKDKDVRIYVHSEIQKIELPYGTYEYNYKKMEIILSELLRK